MKKKFVFGFFIVTFIAINVFFNNQYHENDISLSQMLKLSQANAEWPYDHDECSTYQSNIHSIRYNECLTKYITDYDCEMLLGGGCFPGRKSLWVDKCTGEAYENDYTTYLSCGS